jgi:hypothetical protein
MFCKYNFGMITWRIEKDDLWTEVFREVTQERMRKRQFGKTCIEYINRFMDNWINCVFQTKWRICPMEIFVVCIYMYSEAHITSWLCSVTNSHSTWQVRTANVEKRLRVSRVFVWKYENYLFSHFTSSCNQPGSYMGLAESLDPSFMIYSTFSVNICKHKSCFTF